MGDAILRWFHIIGVAIWVGPQFFLFIAAIPSLRIIENMGLRASVLHKLTRRFLYLSGAGMLLILVFGLAMVFDDSIYPDNAGDLRYGTIFGLKMGLFTFILIGALVHAFWVGPRMLDKYEEIAELSGDQAGPLGKSQLETAEMQLRQMRMLSMAVSGVVLLFSLAAMLMGALLATEEYSFRPS